MARWRKTLERVPRGTSDANTDFSELCALLDALGFNERIRGDHHIFTRDGTNAFLSEEHLDVVDDLLRRAPLGSSGQSHRTASQESWLP